MVYIRTQSLGINSPSIPVVITTFIIVKAAGERATALERGCMNGGMHTRAGLIHLLPDIGVVMIDVILGASFLSQHHLQQRVKGTIQ